MREKTTVEIIRENLSNPREIWLRHCFVSVANYVRQEKYIVLLWNIEWSFTYRLIFLHLPLKWRSGLADAR